MDNQTALKNQKNHELNTSNLDFQSSLTNKFEKALELIPKVLVVEDDHVCEPIWQYVLTRIHPDIQYQWATSGNEAQSFIKQAEISGRPFDLIITDIFLPGSISGIDLWNKYSQTYNDKMLIVSGVEEDKVKQLINTNENKRCFIQKPLNVKTCLDFVKMKLKRKFKKTT